MQGGHLGRPFSSGKEFPCNDVTASSREQSTVRTDMKKVLTERPRQGSIESYKSIRRRENRGDPDLLPSHQGIRRPYRDPKEFSDLIGPLKRFLAGCVGRKWDDVWSEICDVLSPDSHIDNHLLLHVDMEVEQHVEIIGDDLYSIRPYHGLRRIWKDLYVDPRDGILYRNEDWRHFPTYPRPIVIDGWSYRKGEDGILYPLNCYYPRSPAGRYPMKLIGREKAMLIEGVWYWIEMAETPPARDVTYLDHGELKVRRVFSPCYDVVRGETVHEGRYHASKRQMCSRDLRKNGLRNE
jgi:hypothetical protein